MPATIDAAPDALCVRPVQQGVLPRGKEEQRVHLHVRGRDARPRAEETAEMIVAARDRLAASISALFSSPDSHLAQPGGGAASMRAGRHGRRLPFNSPGWSPS